MSIEQQIAYLQPLVDLLKKAIHSNDRVEILFTETDVGTLIREKFGPYQRTKKLTSEEYAALASLFAAGQGDRLFGSKPFEESFRELWDGMIRTLVEIDQFYRDLGGILGYHLTVLKLIQQQSPSTDNPNKEKYVTPEGVDLSQNSLLVRQSIIHGIKALPHMAEMYPVGGAGDRLNLHDEKDGKCLPAARLQFCGKSLLHGLIRDLYAREYLYYKLYGTQPITPIALMTSHEKDNHAHITDICDSDNWLGRPRDSFFLFNQPLAPVITKDGDWVMSAPLNPELTTPSTPMAKLLLKPGGHGVMWKQAQELGVLDRLVDNNRSAILVRQINNPIAGTDHGILAFIGIGYAKKYSFGFMSCPRLINTTEGMLALIEKQNTEDLLDYHIGNIEYTEFAHRGIVDAPLVPGKSHSIFPANTNILFADLETIKRALTHSPIPGMLINMKSKYPSIDASGTTTEVVGGRLESTMQNISDAIIDTFSAPLDKESHHLLSTYIVYNDRHKTIAPTKVSYQPGKSINETPEGAFYTMMKNNRDMLADLCHVEVPPMNSEDDYLREGASTLFLYHPALGPLYAIIAQKIRGGIFAYNAELQLEISDIDIQYIQLHGSLLIEAECVMGHSDDEACTKFSSFTGKCVLKNVSINNRGIDRTCTNQFWKNEIQRHEALTIHLQGDAEFYAENVTIKGNHMIKVPAGHRMTAYQDGDGIQFKLEPIAGPTWQWKYTVNDQAHIILYRT